MTTARLEDGARLRRDESQERTRRLLLDAASALFARDGFRATSLADVAAAAGFSKGAVYSNFASKEHLFLAAIESEYGTSLGDLADQLAGVADLPRRLEILGDWFEESIAGHPQRARATAEFALTTDADPEIRERVAALRARLAAVVEAMLADQQVELGIAYRLPPAELALVMLALVDGLVIQDTYGVGSADRFRSAAALLLAPA